MATPLNKSSGASHDKSNVKTCATNVVPTSAPITTEIPAAVPIARLEAKEAHIIAVAVELWRIAVTPMPARNALTRFEVLAAMTFCSDDA